MYDDTHLLGDAQAQRKNPRPEEGPGVMYLRQKERARHAL